MHSDELQRCSRPGRRILHIYGHVVLESEWCPDCQQQAFIIAGVRTCCRHPATKRDYDGLKIEVDLVGKKRKRLSAFRKKCILDEQNNRCFYCEDEFNTWRTWEGKPRLVKLQWDHVVPFSYDGNSEEFVASCQECNQIKYAHHFADREAAKTYLKMKIYEKKTSRRA